MLGDFVNGRGVDGCADRGVGIRVARIRGREVLGEVVEDRCEAVVFVKAREGASCELQAC